MLSFLCLFIIITLSSAQDPPYYTCALNHETNPCPPPRWKPTYNLTLSTICQPGNGVNSEGYFIPPPDKPWGFVSLDWSVASAIWMHNTTNRNKSTIEETSITGCGLIKNNSNPNTRCMIYHNMEVAIEAIESQRAVMYDQPAHLDWFLQYTDGKGNSNGTIYNFWEVNTGDQYFWDFRNPDVVNYYIQSVLNTTMQFGVDGSYTDDVLGIPHGHKGCTEDMNLTQAEVTQIDKAQQEASQKLIDTLVANGKYNWQAFGYQDYIGPGITQSGCTQFMKSNCGLLNNNTNGNFTMTMSFNSSNAMQSLAAFLIVRPEFAWLGGGTGGWESDMSDWNKIFLYDVGEPKEDVCTENGNVFQREWSYGTVSIDCNKWEATVPHK